SWPRYTVPKAPLPRISITAYRPNALGRSGVLGAAEESGVSMACGFGVKSWVSLGLCPSETELISSSLGLTGAAGGFAGGSGAPAGGSFMAGVSTAYHAEANPSCACVRGCQGRWEVLSRTIEPRIYWLSK